MRRVHRQPSVADIVFSAVVVALTVMAVRIWWLSQILPGMDYPQFIVFVRAVKDYRDPASPFHGTYTTGPWITPTSLPIHLTVLLSYLCGGSVESGRRLLFSLLTVGLVAATLYLLKPLGRSRWAVVLPFPFIHSRWSGAGGIVDFSPALPLVVLGW